MPAHCGRRPRQLALLLALTLLPGLMVLLASTVSPAQAAEGAQAGKPDIAHVPKHCFAPGQSTPPAGPCYINSYDAGRPTVLVWGDSQAFQVIPALRVAVHHEDVNLVSFVAGSCPPTLIPVTPDDHYQTKCELNNVLALRWVQRVFERHHRLEVVLGSNWSGFRESQRELARQRGPATGYDDFTKRMVHLSGRYTGPLFRELARLRVPTDVIGQAATVPDGARPCPAGNDPYLCDLPRQQAILHEGNTRRWLQGLMTHLAGQRRLIDSSSAYCDATVCHGRIGDVNTFFDDLHLTATLARTLWPYFVPAVHDLRVG